MCVEEERRKLSTRRQGWLQCRGCVGVGGGGRKSSEGASFLAACEEGWEGNAGIIRSRKTKA